MVSFQGCQKRISECGKILLIYLLKIIGNLGGILNIHQQTKI